MGFVRHFHFPSLNDAGSADFFSLCARSVPLKQSHHTSEKAFLGTLLTVVKPALVLDEDPVEAWLGY